MRRLLGVAVIAGLGVATALAVEQGLLPLEWWSVSGSIGGVSLAASSSISREERTAGLLAVAERDSDGRAFSKPTHVARLGGLTTSRAETVLADLAASGWIENGQVEGAYSLTADGRERVLVCEECGGVERVIPSREGRFCSVECKNDHKRETVECAGCGASIERRRSRTEGAETHYCDAECQRSRVEVECEWCGATDEVKAYRAESARFCSIDCSGAYGRAIRYGHDFEPGEMPRPGGEPDDTLTLTRGQIEGVIEGATVGIEQAEAQRLPGGGGVVRMTLDQAVLPFDTDESVIESSIEADDRLTVESAIDVWREAADLPSLTVEQAADANERREALAEQFGFDLPPVSKPGVPTQPRPEPEPADDEAAEPVGDGDLTAACPECDSTPVNPRVQKKPRYKCEVCAATFDEPTRRPRKGPRPNGGHTREPRTCGLCGTETRNLIAHLPECPQRDAIGVAAGGAD